MSAKTRYALTSPSWADLLLPLCPSVCVSPRHGWGDILLASGPDIHTHGLKTWFFKIDPWFVCLCVSLCVHSQHFPFATALHLSVLLKCYKIHHIWNNITYLHAFYTSILSYLHICMHFFLKSAQMAFSCFHFPFNQNMQNGIPSQLLCNHSIFHIETKKDSINSQRVLFDHMKKTWFISFLFSFDIIDKNNLITY